RSPTRPRSRTTWSTEPAVSRWLTASPAWPAPITTTVVRAMEVSCLEWVGGSADLGVDDHVGAVGQDVVDGRAAPGLLDQGQQLLLGGVALEVEVDLDLAVAVAHGVRHAEDPEEVDVALDRRRDLVEVDAAGGGDVGHPRGEAGGD